MTTARQLDLARAAPHRAGARRGAGYTLVALIVVFTVMTIALAAAMPMWTTIVKRDKEAELIFRGLQYAEAIRLFQLRFGRYPVRLDELVKVNPRCVRQLWKDPMTESGEWGLIFVQAAQGGPGGSQGRRGRRRGVAPQQQQAVVPGARDPSAGSGPGGPGGRATVTIGPIFGVHSLSQDKALRSFVGGDSYNQWLFTANMLPAAAVMPGSLSVPRPTSEWIGKPFPPGLEPRQGAAPGQPGQPPAGKNPADPQRRRRRRG